MRIEAKLGRDRQFTSEVLDYYISYVNGKLSYSFSRSI